MENVALSTEYQVNYGVSKGFSKFLNYVAKGVISCGDNLALAFQCPQVAKTLDLDVKTINRYVSKMVETGLGKKGTKRGRTGGTVMVVNKELLSFKVKPNVLTKESKKLDDILSLVYPDATKPQPLRHYRTKDEITREKLLEQARQTKNWKLNQQLKNMSYPTKDFFRQFDEPDIAYKAYIASRVYNAMGYLVPKEMIDNTNFDNLSEEGKTEIRRLKKAYTSMEKNDILANEFVGTSRFNHFIKLVKFMDYIDADLFTYLSSQFNLLEFMTRIGKAKGSYGPFVNSLVSAKALERFYSNKDFYKHLRREYNMYANTGLDTPISAFKYPVMQVLRKLYKEGIDGPGNTYGLERLQDLIDRAQMCHEIKEPMSNDDDKLNEEIRRTYSLGCFSYTVLEDLKTSNISQEDKDTIISFLDQQTRILDRRYMPTKEYIMLAPVQLISKIQSLKKQFKNNRDAIAVYMGNTGEFNLWDVEKDQAKLHSTGLLILDSLSEGNTTWESTMMSREHMNYNLDPRDVLKAIQNYGDSKIPLNEHGMLDVTQIEEKFHI